MSQAGRLFTKYRFRLVGISKALGADFSYILRSLDDAETERFTMEAVKLAGRALYLVPDDRSAEKVKAAITTAVKHPTFDAAQIETSKAPFWQQCDKRSRLLRIATMGLT